ncbi:choice-of-anchor Q domain-containing protein [Paludibacter sp. 221]|uniref:choice-of-anchor Q domain-containing protein n=1 Tax=Paludibacter sp. 221 TaxID=2302939 RepID=UPI0013D6AF22|nr:choice-of-anchor Q domain-containing protein [Paludibacter sp. 221]
MAQDRTFVLPKDVKIYGGFDPDNGIKTLVDKRVLPLSDATQGSILSGDLNGDGKTLAYHLIVSAGDVGTTVLDGFTITGAKARGANNSIKINNQDIHRRYGGGLFIISSSPSLCNLKIEANEATAYGGGIYMKTSSSAISHVTIIRNKVDSNGGGIYMDVNSTSTMKNSLIVKNAPSGSGGGLFITGATSTMEFTNVTISDNTGSASSTAIYRSQGTVTLKNSIVQGKVYAAANTVLYNHCLVEGGTLAAGTIISNYPPQFMNVAADNYRLVFGSPAINIGNNALASGINLDLDGNARISDSVVDLGAFEANVPALVADADGIVYVKDYGENTVPDGANGSSWDLAFPGLSYPLAASARPAAGIDSIFVAIGNYAPEYKAGNGLLEQDRAFVLAPNVKVYGGFDPDNDIRTLDDERILPVPGNGDETSMLSGYLNADSTLVAYHVVVSSGNVGTAVLDGFTITGGNANGTGNTAINLLNVNRTYGGGVHVINSSPVLRNLNIDSNASKSYGGGMYAIGASGAVSTLNMSKVSIVNNTTTNSSGGGLFLTTQTVFNIKNGLFAGNSSGTAAGGGIYAGGTSAELTHVTIADNVGAAASTALYRAGGTVKFYNSIIRGKLAGASITYSYCLHQGGTLTANNTIISVDDPEFISDEAGDYRLMPHSPAVDVGYNDYVANIPVDLEGNPRIYNNVVDLGAYESQIRAVVPDAKGIAYVKDYGTGAVPADADGSSWEKAYPNLAMPMLAAGRLNSDIDSIFVAVGTYVPLYRSGNGLQEKDRTFRLVNDLRVYGGFDPDNGIRTLDDERIFAAPGNTVKGSILSGDYKKDKKNMVYHVVVSAGDVGEALLDGFTITKGYAYGSGVVKINNQNFYRYSGAAINLSASSPTLRRLNIVDNMASTYGGGLSLDVSSAPLVTMSSFVNNKAYYGGAIYNVGNSSPKVTSTLIAGNTGTAVGGGVYTAGATSMPVFTNVTIADNKGSASSTAIYRAQGTITVNNSIVWGRVSGTVVYNHSLLQNGTIAAGTIVSNANPQFVDAPAYNYRLLAGSEAIDLGENTLSAGIELDLDGNERIYNSIVDLGAYELRRLPIVPDANGIVYVKDYGENTVPADADGRSWERAYPNLSDPLQDSGKPTSDIDSIFVAVGIYRPLYKVGTGTEDEDRSFVLEPNVKLYGGFDPDNGIRTLEDKRILPTPFNAESTSILSGYLNSDSTLVARHVVISSGDVGTATLDGFSIMGGNANGTNSTISINGFTVNRTYGGGLYITSSAPVLRNLNIESNASKSYGGGIYAIGTSAKPSVLNLSHVSVMENSTTNAYGGGIYIGSYTSSNIDNSLIAGNSAGTSVGGGVYAAGTTVTLTHVTIADNKGATASTALYRGGGTVTLRNSVVTGKVAGSVTYSYCLLQGGTLGTNNTIISIDDPLFVNDEGRDYRLVPMSPAVNVGLNTYAAGMSTDLDGNPRIYNNIVDLGAYEVQRRAVAPDANGIVYVKDYGTGVVPDAADGSSWELAYPNLSDPLLAITRGNTDITTIYVAVGTYIPLYGAGNGRTERDRTFALLPDIKIYGGFDPDNGIRTLNDKRIVSTPDKPQNGSVLSGEIRKDGKTNAYHVVISVGDVKDAVLDGFTITKGNANGRSSIKVNNQYIYRTYGAGLFVTTSSPVLRNLNIANNTASSYGGGLYLNASAAVIDACSFVGNKTSQGAGIYNTNNSTPRITNTLITGNNATSAGSGIYSGGAKSAVELTNVTIVDNLGAKASNAIYCYQGTVTLNNSIVNGKVSATKNTVFYNNCLVVDAVLIADQIILNGDPMFVDAANSNYRLQRESPAVNAGKQSLYVGLEPLTTLDLAANLRFRGSEIDLGAYEYYTENKWIGTVNTSWSTSGNWAMDVILGENEALIFDEEVVNDLVLVSGETHTVSNIENLTNKKIYVGAGSLLETQGSVFLKNQTSLVIGSASGLPNGTFLYPQGVSISATVEMFSVASVDTEKPDTDSGKYKWQYMGVPVKGTAASASFAGSYLRRWNESGTDEASNYYWTEMTGTDVMEPFAGYEVTSKTANRKYTFRGELVNDDYSKTFTRTTGGKYEGQHVISNPYTAGIDISKMTFDGGLEETVYIYNTGSYADWKNNDGTSASGVDPVVAGQFVSIPKNHAGTAGLLSNIPSMQGYLVKLEDGQDSGTLSFDYADVVGRNTAPQRVSPILVNDSESLQKVYTIVDVLGDTSADRLWIFTEANSTRGYDNGWDGRKMFGGSQSTQIYASETDGNYQVNTVPDINNTLIGFAPATQGEYTLRFSHENVEETYNVFYLVDLQLGVVTDITASGTEYKFTASGDGDMQKRFRIVTNAQDTADSDNDNVLHIYTENRSVYAYNKGNSCGDLYLYDLSGRIIVSRKISPYGVTVISGYPLDGVYIVKAVMENDSETVTEKVIIK